jgi:hypothetical protein
MKFEKFLDIEEGVRSSRPRSGGGKTGSEATMKLKYHKDLMDKGMDSKEAFKIVVSTSLKDLKKMGY